MNLEDYRLRWLSKPALQIIYNQYYDYILKKCAKGSILEVGGGSGNFKARAPQIFSVDIQPAPWLDCIADAQSLPFPDCSFDNIVMIDVLHHVEYPTRFLSEASRVLREKGRLIMLEPSITPVSWIFYKLFHGEIVDMSSDPFTDGLPNSDRKPFEANQAIPTLIFLKRKKFFKKKFPDLQLLEIRLNSMFVYPLSGGFKSWCIIPLRLIKPLLKVEDYILPLLGKLMSFRMFVILEKQSA